MGKAMMAVNAAAWPPHQPQITSDGRPRIIVKRATSELYVNAPPSWYARSSPRRRAAATHAISNRRPTRV